MALNIADEKYESWRLRDQAINYRGLRPAHAVARYSRNPGVAKVIIELADTWHAAAMSTEDGKPKGVIPGTLKWPQGTAGMHGAERWFHNGRNGKLWTGGSGYAPLLLDLAIAAVQVQVYLLPLVLVQGVIDIPGQ